MTLSIRSSLLPVAPSTAGKTSGAAPAESASPFAALLAQLADKPLTADSAPASTAAVLADVVAVPEPSAGAAGGLSAAAPSANAISGLLTAALSGSALSAADSTDAHAITTHGPVVAGTGAGTGNGGLAATVLPVAPAAAAASSSAAGTTAAGDSLPTTALAFAPKVATTLSAPVLAPGRDGALSPAGASGTAAPPLLAASTAPAVTVADAVAAASAPTAAPTSASLAASAAASPASRLPNSAHATAAVPGLSGSVTVESVAGPSTTPASGAASGAPAALPALFERPLELRPSSAVTGTPAEPTTASPSTAASPGTVVAELASSLAELGGGTSPAAPSTTSSAASASLRAWPISDASATAALVADLKGSSTSGVQRLTLRLDPADLGSVQLTLTVRGNEVSVALTSESAGAAAALAGQREGLLRALADRGLDLSSFTVSADGEAASGDREHAFAARDSSREQSRQSARRDRGGAETAGGTDTPQGSPAADDDVRDIWL